MGSVSKAVLVNLVGVVIYAGALYVWAVFGEDADLAGWIFLVGIGMMVHSGVALVAGGVLFMMGRPKWGKGMWVCTLLLLLIGFSTCIAAFTGFH